MARVVKDAEVRREELLDTALELFLADGYDRVSVEQITRAADVAKGTFYHYFTSKQELLEELLDRFVDMLFTQAEPAVEAAGDDALARLRALMTASSSAKLGHRDETLLLTRPLFAEDNAMLLARLVQKWKDRTRPLILDITSRGAEQGTFDIDDPEAMTEVWLSLWYDYGIGVSRMYFAVEDGEADVERLLAATKALEVAQERILGLPAGGLGLDFAGAVEQVIEG